MIENLVKNTAWQDKRDSHTRGAVRIDKVENGQVTFEINEKVHEGPDYMTSNWSYNGTKKTLSVEDFEDKYRYVVGYNLDHELVKAKERLARVSEALIGAVDLDLAEAEALVNLFAKTVLNEAAVRIELLDWDTGCCGDDVTKASGEIETELTADEISLLESL